jgi:hypothetical protein
MHFRFFLFLFLLHVSMHLRSWGKHVIMTIWLFCRFLFFGVCGNVMTIYFPNGDLYVIISPLYERVCTWCRPSTEVKKGSHLCEAKHVLGFSRFGILDGKNRIYLKPRSLYPTNSNQVIRHVFCVWFWFLKILIINNVFVLLFIFFILLLFFYNFFILSFYIKIVGNLTLQFFIYFIFL